MSTWDFETWYDRVSFLHHTASVIKVIPVTSNDLLPWCVLYLQLPKLTRLNYHSLYGENRPNARILALSYWFLLLRREISSILLKLFLSILLQNNLYVFKHTDKFKKLYMSEKLIYLLPRLYKWHLLYLPPLFFFFLTHFKVNYRRSTCWHIDFLRNGHLGVGKSYETFFLELNTTERRVRIFLAGSSQVEHNMLSIWQSIRNNLHWEDMLPFFNSSLMVISISIC